MIVFNARGRRGVAQLHFLPGNELAVRTGTGLCVWDLDTRALRIDDDEAGQVPYLFARDGRSVVRFAYARGLGVYSLAEARWHAEPLQGGYVHFLLWSPDGLTLMAGSHANARPADHFYRVADWQPALEFFTRQMPRSSDGRVVYHYQAAISPDGRRAVTYSSGTLSLYDLTADKFVKTITLPIEHPVPGLFTPDGSRFLVWSMFKIYAIDLDAGKVALAYPACPRAVHGATLTPDGRHLLQVSADRTVRVLDAGTGRLVKDYAWNAGKLAAVAVSPDGLLAACGGSGGKVVVWDLDL